MTNSAALVFKLCYYCSPASAGRYACESYGHYVEMVTLVDALETQLAASRATAANLLSALVAELTTA